MADVNTETLDRLRFLNIEFDTTINKHGRVFVLVHACLSKDIEEGPEILNALTELGYNRPHVGKLLADECGSHPESHQWVKLPSGRYRSHGMQ